MGICCARQRTNSPTQRATEAQTLSAIICIAKCPAYNPFALTSDLHTPFDITRMTFTYIQLNPASMIDTAGQQ
jgi:hypothetical protein